MGRPRTAHVRQHRRTLELLALTHRGTPGAKAISLLLALKEHPERSFREIAAEIGVSKPTVDRWWRIYREKGLDALLELRRRGKTRRSMLDAASQQRLRVWLSLGSMRSISEIHSWISDELGIRYSRSGLRNLLRRLGCRPSSGTALGGLWSPVESSPASGETSSDGHLFELIASLPETCDMFESIKAFSAALSKALPEVDRVVVSVDTQTDLIDPAGYNPNLISLQDATQAGGARSRRRIALRAEVPIGEDILDDMKRCGYPLAEYHPPYFVDFFYRENAYVGSVFLFRRRDSPSFSNATVAAFASLEPIVRFVLTDIVVRHNYVHPRERVFYDAVRRMTEEAHLTRQERRVIHYRLLGLSYDMISDELNITESTVKKHLRSVHVKTGTSCFAELVAKYLTPPTLPE